MAKTEPFMALVKSLAREIKLTSDLQGLDSQFHRRLHVRVFFSVLDGYAFHLRHRALEAGDHQHFPFSKTQREKLKEQEEKRQPDGSIRIRNFFLKSQEGLLFAINIYAKVMGVQEPAPPEPADLEVGFATRDRLTHPKTAADFDISQPEAEAVGRLTVWFADIVRWYSQTEIAYIERIRTQMNASIQAQADRLRARSE